MRQIIINKDTEALRELIKGDADVVNALIDDCSPLLGCVYAQSIDCAKILLEAKADVNGNKSHPPLYSACNFGRTDFVKLLIEHKADICLQRPENGLTPLHLVVCSRDMAYLKIFMTTGGASKNIDVKAYGEYTALYYACKKGLLPFISLLLDNGAKIKELNKSSQHSDLFEIRKNIKRTLIVFYHLGRKNKWLGKDVTNMIGKMVWETRDRDEWLTQNLSKKYKI
jgi:ankyrin repeat protein